MVEEQEIWMVYLSISENDVIGHEQGELRPCIVIKPNDRSKLATIVPLTTNLAAMKFPDTYDITRSTENGLISDSIALIFQLRTLSYQRFEDYLGVLEDNHFERIKEIIKDFLEL